MYLENFTRLETVIFFFSNIALYNLRVFSHNFPQRI